MLFRERRLAGGEHELLQIYRWTFAYDTIPVERCSVSDAMSTYLAMILEYQIKLSMHSTSYKVPCRF